MMNYWQNDSYACERWEDQRRESFLSDPEEDYLEDYYEREEDIEEDELD